jgi:pyruvate kinase
MTFDGYPLTPMRHAKIVCTIGPASSSPAVIDQLIESGMNVARLNFSHGTHASHGQAIVAIREAAARRKAVVAILQDLQGPRIRVGALPSDIEVHPDQRVLLVGGVLRAGGQLGAQAVSPRPAVEIPITYPTLARDVRPGARILIDDGLIELRACTVGNGAVECQVVTGGRISTHKGVNLPGTAVTAPAIAEKDRDDLQFGVTHGVDYIALSFVRSPEDVRVAHRMIADCGGTQPIIAKIERAEAIENLPALLDAAAGVMIARGDLGVEMGPEAVPMLQKRIIAEANQRRKLVITATQMLESMTKAARPTRAEASDVANAVFDGTDAVMLSAETARGQYPVEAVRVMDRLVRAAEEDGRRWNGRSAFVLSQSGSIPDAMCEAAASVAKATNSRAIVVFSESGATARLLSKQRAAVPIIAFTPNDEVLRRMTLYWGVTPFVMPHRQDPDARVREVERRLKAEKLADTGDRLVLLSGTVAGQPGGTNVLQVYQVA